MSVYSRRSFVHATGLAAFGLGFAGDPPRATAQTPAAATANALSGAAPAEWLPMQDPAMVKEMVTVSHFNAKRVSELVEAHPELANAAVDWGFGDWESALGAASHVGRRDIAETLIASGARCSIFSAAMLGQLDVVKAFIAARPGVQRTLGPHNITLLAHAKAGGADAAAVVTYLETVGDADTLPRTTPLETSDRDALVGRYTFGPGARDFFEIDVDKNQLGIVRPGTTRRGLLHLGSLVFFPMGAPSVRIAFARASDKVTHLTVAEPEVYLTAHRT